MDIGIILFIITPLLTYVFCKPEVKGSPEIAAWAKDEYKKCKDEQGFIAFFYWREALYGACVLLVGILGILDKTVWKLGKLNYVEVLIILAGYVWFQHSLNQARDQFFRKF